MVCFLFPMYFGYYISLSFNNDYQCVFFLCDIIWNNVSLLMKGTVYRPLGIVFYLLFKSLTTSIQILHLQHQSQVYYERLLSKSFLLPFLL